MEIPGSHSILTTNQYEYIKDLFGRDFAKSSLSEDCRHIWPQSDIDIAIKNNVWNKGYVQIRIDFRAGGHIIYYYKNKPQHRTDIDLAPSQKE